MEPPSSAARVIVRRLATLASSGDRRARIVTRLLGTVTNLNNIVLKSLRMVRHATLVMAALQLAAVTLVSSAKQQVQLSDSYLPVAMQIIAHLTDQMAFETRDDVAPSPQPTTRPTTTTTRPTTRPTYTWSTSTTSPYVTSSWYPAASKPTTNGWWMGYTTTRRNELTTPFHKPGLYAPFSPPKPFFNRYQSRDFLLPLPAPQYEVLLPEEAREGVLLGISQEEVQPLVEPGSDEAPLLPPHFDVKISSRSDGFLLEDISADSLQYLSDDVRDLVQMARDPHDERLVDVWQRAGAQPAAASKAKLSGSNLRLLLLYDLLSRDAKKQRLSDYSGFSPDVMKVLVESSSGGARAQLRTALSKMVERKDCGHDYANNRAREMVDELAKDESKLSSELRYLQPLVYKY